MKKIKSLSWQWLIPGLIIALYLFSHLYQLTLLPVFADEAIYIRWAQLIIDDWQQYLFFPLNDGKTPFFFWLLVPWQFIFSNQLFAGRFLVVLVGLLQIISLKQLVKTLGGKKKTQWLAMLLTSILPFWYFHHRLVLTDSLLTLALTWLVTASLQLIKVTPRKKIKWLFLTGLSLGLALWSKLPALLLLPIIPFYPWLKPISTHKEKLINLLWLALAFFLGFILFFVLKLHPAFPQLFARGSDFLFPWKTVLLEGAWRQTLISIPTYLNYFTTYLSWPLVIISLLGLFLPNKDIRHSQRLLILSALTYAGPIVLLGRVVYPRYFLPVNIFLTASAALSVQQLIQIYSAKKTLFWKKIVILLILGISLVMIVFKSGDFIYAAVTNPAQIPLVEADKEQHLYKWSAGYGIKETIEYIKELTQNQSVAMATEGNFGTLPDGALLYLHRTDVDQIYLEGIGYPVKGLTDKFVSRARNFDQVFLLVNSNRLLFELPEDRLKHQYCRPNQSPCLQLWDITGLIDELPLQN